ncbi:hypothetical protein ACVNS2_33935 [Paenibacillus caseinilyticus]|uniref:Uncharacterized protein n=1 Tax=Paenibacillus mucilaginosus K02 TaxID=997761 RepID=I0BTL3_9BACL|nr:hypothetical protein [Paenibacillus mucilaginosus]AFH65710.1 hypothetical protein B2K_34265 [Paenibacillus mucilaginosus K02]WFA21810.1 hypothetical protein ERY13_33740 [Paenibacillus mucilaginosus]
MYILAGGNGDITFWNSRSFPLSFTCPVRRFILTGAFERSSGGTQNKIIGPSIGAWLIFNAGTAQPAGDELPIGGVFIYCSNPYCCKKQGDALQKQAWRELCFGMFWGILILIRPFPIRTDIAANAYNQHFYYAEFAS